MSDRPKRGLRPDWEAETARVYRRDQHYVYRETLKYLGRDRHAEADAITNEALLRAFTTYGWDFTTWPEAAARAALVKIAKNLARNLFKAEQKQRWAITELGPLLAATREETIPDPQPEKHASLFGSAEGPDTRTGEERIAALFKSLLDSDRLSPREYTMAIMTWDWKWDGARIAKALSTTPKAVYTARTRLKGTIRELAETENLTIVFPDTAAEDIDRAGELGEGGVTA